MLTNAEIKQIRSLREKKFRDALGLFVVEGEKMVREALDSSFEVVRVCRVEEEGEKAMEKMSQFSTPSPVLAVVRKPALEWAGTDIPAGLSLALDSVRDPGNMGTIIRTADWFGVRRIVCSQGSVSCYNPKVVQSTMGGLFRTEITYTDLPAYLSGCNKPVYGALLDGESIWGGTPFHLPQEGAVLVIGNESRGITPEVQQHITHRIAIPNLGGTAESLNASVACAILMAELLK